MKLSKLTWWLLIIGGLNWLLVGLFSRDVIDLLGLGMTVGRVVYVLVGLSALHQLFGKKSM